MISIVLQATTPEKTIQCLTSIRSKTPIPFELVLVASPTLDLAKVKPYLDLCQGQLVDTLEAAIDTAQSDLIVLLGQPVQILTRGCMGLITALLADPEVGTVGPVINDPASLQTPKFLGTYEFPGLPSMKEYRRGKGLDFIQGQTIRTYGSLSLACVAFRKADGPQLLEDKFYPDNPSRLVLDAYVKLL